MTDFETIVNHDRWQSGMSDMLSHASTNSEEVQMVAGDLADAVASP